MADGNVFKSDLRDLEFALFEQFRLVELLERAPFKHLSEDDARMILTEAQTFAAEVAGPTLELGDREGCRLTPEGVRVPEGFQALWRQYYADGWNTLTLPEARGGQGAPELLGVAVNELMSGANTAFYMYPGLSMSAAEVIREVGTPEQQELYAAKLENGAWAGTMVLTEPQAGSDLGLITTKATPQDDGSFLIQGNKIFISGGEHDLAENIVHLVLARPEGAPAGTRGLSLFIVPRHRVTPDGSLGEPNDVVCTHLERKLGIHASATCALNFGESGRCQGFLLGEQKAGGEGTGLRNMFLMMNRARIAVGVQSLAVASTAYLNALAYARERLQGAHIKSGRGDRGAVPIIRHPDVRRMLLEMKALVEGCRRLIYYVAGLNDQATAQRAEDGQGAEELEEYAGLFIPLVKAFCSDTAVHVTSLGLQVFGGAGYTAEFPAELYFRDARIFPIYEGTNGIQALDLVARKLSQKGGAHVRRFIKETQAFVGTLQEHPGFENEASTLGQALERLGAVLGVYMQHATQGKLEQVALTATRFLDAMSRVLIARLLLEGALAAEAAAEGLADDAADRAFYAGKIAAARYFARNLLPPVVGELIAVAAMDDAPLTIPDEGFSLAY